MRPGLDEVRERHFEHPGDAEESAEGYLFAGLDALVRPAADAGREVHGVLGVALPFSFLADACADGSAAVSNPLFVVRQVSHPVHARVIKVKSLPNMLGVLDQGKSMFARPRRIKHPFG